MLADLEVVPVMPGGYSHVHAGRVRIEPGQAFRVPRLIWMAGMAVGRQGWVEEITEEQFLANVEIVQVKVYKTVEELVQETVQEPVHVGELTMADIRDRARALGIKIRVGTTKADALRLVTAGG